MDRVVAVPDGVDLGDAAAVLHDGVTAERLAERTGIGQGEQVLILGAAGGLGFVFPLADAAAAHAAIEARTAIGKTLLRVA
jgi:NADPH2:quinone reductase